MRFGRLFFICHCIMIYSIHLIFSYIILYLFIKIRYCFYLLQNQKIHVKRTSNFSFKPIYVFRPRNNFLVIRLLFSLIDMVISLDISMPYCVEVTELFLNEPMGRSITALKSIMYRLILLWTEEYKSRWGPILLVLVDYCVTALLLKYIQTKQGYFYMVWYNQMAIGLTRYR